MAIDPSFDGLSKAGGNFLAQHGVKGMKWGVRRSKGERPPASDDATRVDAAKAKIKSGGTKALSNKELQDVVTRMNLEQQFGRLSSAQMSKGRKFAQALLGDLAKQQVTRVAKVKGDKIGSLLEDKLKD